MRTDGLSVPIVPSSQVTEGGHHDEVPVDLYIAAYSDPGAAQQDWDDIKQLARDDVIAWTASCCQP